MSEVINSKSNVRESILTIIFLISILGCSSFIQAQSRFYIEDGQIDFESDAPLELIEARTKSMVGILDVDKKAFAIAIPIASFNGFNSSLQKEHFNENYLESEKYPKGIFKGVITDEIDLRKNGYYTVKAHGKLKLHGIEKAREFECDIVIDDGVVNVKSSFDIELVDHKIKIPTIVAKKLSETITVNIDLNFTPKK